MTSTDDNAGSPSHTARPLPHVLPGESTAGIAKPDLLAGIADALARDDMQRERILVALQDGFVPGAGICSAAGTGGVLTMIDCFVQPVADSMSGRVQGMPGIMDAITQAAETMRRGGGVGYDWSDVRPMRAIVKGTGAGAAGPISFMRVADRMCASVAAGDADYGFQMCALRVDHPDIEAFIDANRMPDLDSLGLPPNDVGSLERMLRDAPAFDTRLRMALASLPNVELSVGVTDTFMRAVVSDDDFHLVHVAEPANPTRQVLCEDGQSRYVYRTVRARELWHKIMRSADAAGSLSVIFVDAVNRANSLWYCEAIRTTTPCGEQALPPYGACNVGHNDLARLVVEPFTGSAHFDWERLERLTAQGVELLDRVLDTTRWPLEEQRAEAMSKRRIGIGFLGMEECLAMLGLRYGAAESAAFATEVTRRMAHSAYRASVELARELGPFPLFDADKYLRAGTLASTLPPDIQDAIRKHGIRNSHLTSVARNGKVPDSCSERTSSIRHRAEPVNLSAPSCADQLAMVGAMAPFIDGGLSMTLDVPVGYPAEDFEGHFLDAWRKGLKGLTARRA